MKPQREAEFAIVRAAVQATNDQKLVYDHYKRITATDEATEEDYIKLGEAKEAWKQAGLNSQQMFSLYNISELTAINHK
jgi:hypothetical protein